MIDAFNRHRFFSQRQVKNLRFLSFPKSCFDFSWDKNMGHFSLKNDVISNSGEIFGELKNRDNTF